MQKKILIIGLGIGNLYKNLLKEIGQVITIDTDLSKNPTYYDIDSCIDNEIRFDIVIICCPNFLHEFYVEKLYKITDVVLVEKPGLKDLETWEKYYKEKRNIFMVKNNMWRPELKDIKNEVYNNKDYIRSIKFLWLNKNRIPSPGSWFTNKELAFGGVSRDLIPHLLSIYYYIFEQSPSYESITILWNQFWSLDNIDSTDYGIINKKGVYNVDDYCTMNLPTIGFNSIYCTANWRDTYINQIGIELIWKEKKFYKRENTFFEFGLCPEKCYLDMINYFLNITPKQKEEQYKIDCWIHSILEKIN